jgi:CheY-like chemotaxis protein
MSGGRILLVEDNEANQLLASSVLELSGFVVDVAGDSTEARAMLARKSPDVILMDVQLPGLDGLTFAQQLKAEAATAHIPIIALTALAMAGDRERTLAAGCDGYIAKPINTRTFASEVGKFLSNRP